MGVVRFGGDGVDWEKVMALRRGILGRGLGGIMHVCAVKCTVILFIETVDKLTWVSLMSVSV